MVYGSFKTFRMKKKYFFALIFLLFSIVGKSQKTAASQISPVNSNTSNKNLFDADDVLYISLKGNINKLLNDREGEAKYYPMILTYKKDSNEISIPIHVKTRGHFRRMKSNCTYPPLLLSFPAEGKNSSSFFPEKLSLKLVMPCKGEKFIVHEWLVYKLYNLLTPQSFRARLVKVNLVDEKNKKMPSPFYGFILEDEKQMAERNKMIYVKKKIRPEQTMREPFLQMAVFEYLIGNTDWSVEYLQNIKLIASDSTAVPVAVPYDFDLSGIVDAPYALPAPELMMNSVRERRYRGYCIRDMKLFDSTLALFNRLRKNIYSLYNDCPLLDDKYKKQTLNYLGQFYSIINDPKKLQKEFEYPCLPGGTGNVIIKGLRED
jgi:hypothetical protein